MNQPDRACPACGNTAWQYQWSTVERMWQGTQTAELWRCPCGTWHTASDTHSFEEVYPQHYYAFAAPKLRPPVHPAIKTLVGWIIKAPDWLGAPFKRVLAVLYGSGPVPPPQTAGRVLDVGCGSGQWLATMQRFGWESWGLEPSQAACEAASAAGLNVMQGELSNASLPEQTFDVVRIWHALEHMDDPHAALEQVLLLLKPGGQLIIGVPNSAGTLAQLSGCYWFDLDAPRHIWHWTPTTLQVCVERAGFNVARLQYGYYGGLPALRSLLYWLEAKVPGTARHRATALKLLRWIRRIPPLHGVWWLIERTNYLELIAYRPAR